MKRTAKQIISRLLAFAMVLTILPASVLAAPMTNTSVEDAVVAAVGGPNSGVFLINIRENPSVVGTLDLAELKLDYPNLVMVVADDTNITDVVPQAGVSASTAGTFASGTRQLAPAVNAIVYNAVTANDIDLSALVADLVLNGATDATIADDLIDSIESVTIAGTSVAFTSSNILSGTDPAGLAGLSAGSYPLALELGFKHSTVTTVIQYTLNVLDTSLAVTGPSAVYQGGTYVYTVVKTDENGAQAALSPADLTITTDLLALGSSATMAAAGAAVEITVVIDPSESVATYELEVNEISSGKTDSINFVVQALATVSDLILEEINDGVSAGDITAASNAHIHIKGGTSISSVTAGNIAPGGYSEGTVYLLKDMSTGQPLDASYNAVFSLVDLSGNGNVQGAFINVNGYAAVRISALEASGTDEFSIVAPSVSISETFNYAIQAVPPAAYALYKVDATVYPTLNGLDVQQLVNDNDAAFGLVAEYEYIGGGWNPVGVPSGVVETTILEGKTAYFVVAARYSTNVSDPWFMAPLGGIAWNDVDRGSGVLSPFGSSAADFIECTDIEGRVVTYPPQNTPGLLVTSNVGSGAETVTAAANTNISGGTPNPLYFDIRIIPRSIDGYEFRDASGTSLGLGVNHIAIGSRESYTVFAVYDNGDSVQVNFSSSEFASLTLNTLPANSIFSDVQLGSGVLLTADSTRNGGANDARVGTAETITITDASGNTGTLTLQLSSSLIERFTYYIETPGNVYDYNNPANELKKIYSEAEVATVLSGTVEIPRGLTANVWVVPVFTNDEMYDPAVDTASNNSWQNFGANISCSPGGLTAPVYDNSANAFLLRAYAEALAIGTSTTVGFSGSGTIMSNGVGHNLVSGGVTGTQLNAKIADAVLTNLDIMTYDATGNTYVAVPYSAGQYQLSGNVGDKIILRIKATYSDGAAIDTMATSSTYAGGTFFLPMDTYGAYNPSAGNMTTPASSLPLPLDNFASGTDAEMSVLYGYLMSKDPAAYRTLVNGIGTPSAADWVSPYTPGSDVQGILATLSNLIVPHIVSASIAGGVTFTPAAESGGVVPGHYEIKLLQSGHYELDFSGVYRSNTYNATTAVNDAANNPFSIQLTVSPPAIERTYLVSDDAIFDMRDAGDRNIHRFDTTGLTAPHSFYVYPVILDSSYANTLPANLVGTSDIDTTIGLNYMLAADWEANAFTFSQSSNVLVTREDADGYVRLKIHLLNPVISLTTPETVDFELNSALLQSANPAHSYSAIGLLGRIADTFGVYTSSDPVVIDINIGVDYNSSSASGTNATDLGGAIFYPVRYQFNDGSTRVLADAERPGSAAGPNVLVVTPSASNPGACGVSVNASGALQFTPGTIGTYTFNLFTTNINGDGIPTLSQGDRIIQFTAIPQNLTRSVYYGQNDDISSLLPAGAASLVEDGTSKLDATALSNNQLEMLNNENASVTVNVLDASNVVIATITVTLQRCDEVVELTPASLNGHAFADGESVTVQWKTTYSIPAGGAVTMTAYTNVASAEWAYMGGTADFLALSGNVVTATGSALTQHAVYIATHTSGVSATILVSVTPALVIPTPPTYELRDSGGTVLTSPISLVTGDTQNVFVYDTSTNTQVTSFLTSVSAPGIVSVVDQGSLVGVEVTGTANGTATVTFSPLLGGSVSLTFNVAAAPIGGTTHSVSGFVRDAANNPLTGATVTIGSQTVITDASGAYTVSGVSDGTYAATASQSGFNADNQNITVNGGDMTVDFILTPTGAPAVTVAVTPASVAVGAAATATATAVSFSGTLTYTWDVTPAIATVSGTGATVTITGVSAGTATITCSVTDGTTTLADTASITVTAVVAPPGPGGSGGSSGPSTPAGTFTVSYDANGGTGSKSIAGLARNSKHMVLMLADTGISSENKIFLGWNTQRNGNGTSYDSGAEITLTANVTLYAQWESQAQDIQAQGSLELNTIDHVAYLRGNDKGLFMPDANMTRAEVVQMLYNLMVDTSVSSNNSTFTDVYSDAWYANAVIVLASRGVVKGYTDGTFRPNAPISRAEFVTMLARFDDLSLGIMNFSDVSADHWAYDYIVSASAKGWTNGYVDGTFRPAQSITRSEAVRMTNIMLGRSADQAYVDANPSVNRFSDVPTSHWAYYDIIEATTEHNYTKDNTGAETWK